MLKDLIAVLLGKPTEDTRIARKERDIQCQDLYARIDGLHAKIGEIAERGVGLKKELEWTRKQLEAKSQELKDTRVELAGRRQKVIDLKRIINELKELKDDNRYSH